MDKRQTIKNNIVKDINDSESVLNVFISNTLSKDDSVVYIFKKTEKIVTAIYLVTNFLSDTEPLKNDIRHSANNLLKSVIKIGDTKMSDTETKIKSINLYLLEMQSMFQIAYNSGFVSGMNYQILNNEIEKLCQNIFEYQKDKNQHDRDILNGGYFHVLRESQHVLDKGQKDIKDRNNVPYKHKALDKPFFYGTVRELKEKMSLNSTKPITAKQNNSKRRESIISEIKAKGEISIKDISAVITDCSEKTLQRELLNMVADGILEKSGERRWSKYSLRKTF